MTDTENFEAWFADVQKPAMAKVGIKLAEQKLCHDVALMAWQAALASQQPADDGWIEWAGGECPVNINARVYVRFRDGEISEDAEIAGLLRWTDIGEDWDIIAYRVVKP